MSNGASSPPSSHQPLRIWAVDVSQWPTHQSTKEALRPLLDDFFEPKAPLAAGGVGGAASASTSTSEAKPSTDKDIDDSQRVLRYVREIDRTRSLAALLLPRIAILSMIKQEEVRRQSSIPAEVSWHDLRFDRTREGRPYLSYPSLDHLSLDFNISHDGDWVVMALRLSPPPPSARSPHDDKDDPVPAPATTTTTTTTTTASSLRVGIDVMSLLLPHFESSPSTFLDTMQDSVTPSESEWVRAALNYGQNDEGLERLYDLWTYKEALTKNLGLGLGFDFKRVELAFWECEPEMRGKRRSAGVGVLSMDDKRAPQYVFTEIRLPAGEGNVGAEARRKGSKMVVCEGPYEEGHGDDGTRPQISPSATHTEAVERGLLRMWTMQELVDEGRRLCKRGVSDATGRGELKN